jgi:drug/metabolite transporter (DMT)-like permease
MGKQIIMLLADPTTVNGRIPDGEDEGVAIQKPSLKKRGSMEDIPVATTNDETAVSVDKAIKGIQPNHGLIGSLIAWYAASVVCTNTSKSLGFPWQWLTLAQLAIGSVSAYFGIAVLRFNGNKPSFVQLADLFPNTHAQWQSTIILAACFVGGFVTLNMALSRMHVSTVMTVRAAEPVATLLLGLYYLPKEKTSLRAILALVPVVAGAAIASTASASISPSSQETESESSLCIMIVLLCNCLFALRTIFSKRLKAAFPALDNFTLFFQLCVIGTVLQLVLLVGIGVSGSFYEDETPPTTLRDAMQWDEDDWSIPPKLILLVVNGVSFYAYLQLSWVVMAHAGAVTHSVCNALRRPVICAAGWILFGGATVQGVAGALLATLGTLLYAQAKMIKSDGPGPDVDSTNKRRIAVV